MVSGDLPGPSGLPLEYVHDSILGLAHHVYPRPRQKKRPVHKRAGPNLGQFLFQALSSGRVGEEQRLAILILAKIPDDLLSFG